MRALPALCLCLLSATADAASTLTPAGTEITNRTRLEYVMGGRTVVLEGGALDVVFPVDELVAIGVDVIRSPDISVQSPSLGLTSLFTITNTGNGEEEFTAEAYNVEDNEFLFELTGVYLDDGDGVFEPGTDDQPLTTVNLQAGESAQVWVEGNVPAGVPTGAVAAMGMLGLSVRDPSVSGDGEGDGGTDLALGDGDGRGAGISIYETVPPLFTFGKQATVLAPDGSDVPVPGAFITYQLTATAAAADALTGAVIDDPIPANTTYVPGSLRFDGVAQTDGEDGDRCARLAGPDRIQCSLPTVSSGTRHIVQFQVQIN